MTRVLVSTKELDREEWLEQRRQGIGGSDTPVIILGDEHPFTTPKELWEEKVGIRGSDTATPAMKRGTALESTIATIYAGETERKIRRVNAILQHERYDWMVGNIDREIVGVKGRKPGILEIKCPGLRTFSKIKREGIPDYYQLQMQHYLAVSEREWGAFAIFNAELWELIAFDIDREDDLIDLIYDRDAAFWKMVQEGTPPEEGKTMINPDIPPLQTDMELIRMEGEGWRRAVEDYRTAREILAEAEELESGAKERLQNFMSQAHAQVAEGCGLRVFWQEQAGRETFDHKAFATTHPELVESMRPFYKKGKPFRRFSPHFLEEEKVHE